MLVKFLGTGTSHGVPVLGCNCSTCKSDDPHDNRTRSSAYLLVNDKHILIDTATEMRLQTIRNNISQVDMVLMTHNHADHISGFDDLRRFNEMQNKPTPVYGNHMTLQGIRTMFPYIFNDTVQIGGGKPQIELIEVDAPFTVSELMITPVPIFHGQIQIFGYRIGNFGYITDCSSIPTDSMELLKNLKVLILGVLRFRPHPTHLHLEAGLEIIRKLQPEQTFLTHITHDFKHQEVNLMLPEGVQLGYDGQVIEF